MTEGRRSLRADDDSGSLLPLMDVLFSVLAGLMFCLTIAEFGGRIDIELPGVAAASATKPVENVEVSFDADGAYFIGERQVDVEQLVSELRDAIGTDRRPVIIRGDRAAPFEVSIKLYQAAKAAGARSVMVATKDRK